MPHRSKFVKLRHIWPWVMYALAASFYCYEYLLRVSPSVMMQDLSSAYHVSAAMLGNIVACYYYIYTPMQLPVGILMDRYGPRNLLTMACFSCALGTYWFVCSNNIWVAQAGRFLVGFGSAFAFVGVLQLARLWLPRERFAIVSGLTLMLGMLGGLFGDVVLTDLVNRLGWRQASYAAAAFGFGLSVLLYTVLRNRKRYEHPHAIEDMKHHAVEDFSSLWRGMKNLVSNRQIWINGAIGCMMFVPVSAFAELWGIPFLEVVHGYTKSQSAHAISAIFLGLAFGGPVVGALADKIGCKRKIMLGGAFLACILIAIAIYDVHLNYSVLCGIFFVYGIATSAQVLVFSVSCDHSPPGSTATAMALTNMVVMMSGVIFQPLVGWLLDVQAHDQSLTSNLLAYTASNYQWAMLIMPVCLIGALGLCFILKDKAEITHPAMEDVVSQTIS